MPSLVIAVIGTWAAVAQVRHTPRRPLLPGAREIKSARQLLQLRVRRSKTGHEASEIIARFIFVNHDGRATVGALDQFDITLFLDLFSACTVPQNRHIIAKLMVEHFGTILGERERPTYVVTPKEGNVLLGEAVARMMGMSFIVVRTMIPAIKFGDPLEGIFISGSCVVIVDDIASDGELLARTAEHVRKHGGRTSLCVCAVERMDGNSRERLTEHDVHLEAPMQLDEQTLRSLARLPSQFSAEGKSL